MRNRISENTKITLTMGQLKQLIKESGDGYDDDLRLRELKKAISDVVGFWVDNVTISDGNKFTCGGLRFKVDASEATPWKAISIDKPVIIQGPLSAQVTGDIIGRFINCDMNTLNRLVDLFR